MSRAFDRTQPGSLRLASPGFLLLLLLAAPGWAQYQPADRGQTPAGSGTRLLPESFLRGFDPITVYFADDQVPARANADDGPKRLKLSPEWPGGYVWVDRRTLQFRPAEPWPALARFHVEASGARRVLTTMMAPPQSMSPSDGTEGLRPFRVVTLTFPQSYPVESLKKMLALEIRDLPGLADSPTRRVSRYGLAPLPRASHREPSAWALTLDEEVPEGKQLVVTVSLALGKEGTTLWQGRLSTRTPFALTSVRCGSAEFPLVGGASTPKDLALRCGNRGEAPQLVFSAPVQNLSLTALKKLVRMEPSVPDLRFQTYGARVQLLGKFVPDTLYKMSLSSAPVTDDAGRLLREVKPAEVYFHLGWRTPFLVWQQSTALLEANGPRQLPVRGYGEAKADVRIHRVDPLHPGLWPFPERPLSIQEQSAPPFPGEEPPNRDGPGYVDADELGKHLRLLGSPLVSRLVDLPLADKAGPTTFGLDLQPLLDEAVGPRRPGTYLVGLRRLTSSERNWMRVQVTNLSLTSVAESGRAVLYVRALDNGGPVSGAKVTLEGHSRPPNSQRVSATFTTDSEGRVVVSPLPWSELQRLSVRQGDDVLVLDPREDLPSFANNHWSSASNWLAWLLNPSIPGPVNDTQLSFVFTERPIYRPGETVYLKGFVRQKRGGQLLIPSGDLKRYGMLIRGPDGNSWPLKPSTSPLGGFAAEFKEANVPTGDFTVVLYENNPSTVLATRTFKIEAYRLPTFEVQLTGPTRTRNDRSFKLKAVARYYAGGNVSGRPIQWNVTQRPWDWVPKGLPGFLFASASQFSRPASQPPPGVTSQSGEVDEQGASELTLQPQLDLDGSPRVYRVEATVTGADEQPVTATTEVKALPAFVLGVKVPRYLERATELRPEVVAVGVDEKPVKGQEVRVRLFRRVWHSTLRETSFATGQAKYVTEQEDVQVAEKTLSTLAEPLGLSFPIQASGVYVVELFARDKLGRVQTLSVDLYVGGPTPQAWQKSRDGVFELKPDKNSYQPGETAHVVLQSPYTQATALVILEEPEGNRYFFKDVAGGKAVIDVKVTERFVPNLPLHVVLMRGRIGEGKADDARYRPATVASSVDLVVQPTRHTVHLGIQHPEVARPGTTQNITLTLADEGKRPLGGEVTLWLVDEAVLSLAHEQPLDPLTQMIRRNQRAVSIRDTRNLVVGRLAELEEEPGGDGGDEEEGKGKKRVRKNFKTVPYYAATVTVPPSGTLTVPVTLSDDLTTFKVRAVAVSGAMRFGFKQTNLKVRLPVLVQPQLPRFVRLGDRFWPGAVARLVEGAAGPGVVDIKVSGAVEGKVVAKESVALSESKALSVLTPVTVKSGALRESALTVRVDLTRLSDKASDAFEMKLPLLLDRPEEKRASFLSLSPGATALPGFAEKPRPGTGEQTFIFTNQPGLLELASALDYLSAYPHGCLEQRMSQVSPDLALGGLLRRLELDTRFTLQLSASTRRILDELKQHQNEQGFFSYWPGGAGDLALTAQGVEFLTAAQKAGLTVDPEVKRRAMEALRRVLRTDFNGLWADYRYNQQTAALRALGGAGELDENYLIELFGRRKSMDAVSLADLTSTMALRPNTFNSHLQALKGELWDTVQFKLVRGKQVFEAIRGDRRSWSGLYLGSSAATTGAVWEALLRVDPRNERHLLLRDALLAQSVPGRGFGTTHANRRAIAALGAYLEQSAVAQPRTEVQLTGAAGLTLDDKKKAGRRVVSSDEAVPLEVLGGPVTVRVQQRSLPAALGDKVEAKKEGLIVSRRLTRYPQDGSAPTQHDDVAGAVLKVQQGEVLEIHAQLVVDQPVHHVALVVPFAAGLEPLNPALKTSGSEATPSQPDSTTPTFVQRMDEEVRYYFTSLPAGTHTFHFRVRAANEGSFVHPAPYGELMYREEVRGRGNGLRVVVTGEHER